MSISSILGDLSSSCQGALTGLLTSDFSTCANVLGIANIASASGSVVTPVNTYIQGICTNAPCTQAALNNASSTIQTGCSSDLSSGSSIPVALEAIVNNYGDIRSLLCTKQTANNTYCVTQTLYAVQNTTGTQLTITALEGIFSNSSTSNFLDSIPTSVYCTDCGHAIVTEALPIVQNVSSSDKSTFSKDVSDKCGASFVDGKLPSDISTVSNSSESTSSSKSVSAGRSLVLSSKTVAVLGALAAAMAVVGTTLA